SRSRLQLTRFFQSPRPSKLNCFEKTSVVQQAASLGIPSIRWDQIRAIQERSDLFGNLYLDLLLEPSGDASLNRNVRRGTLSLIITRLDVPAKQIREKIMRN